MSNNVDGTRGVWAHSGTYIDPLAMTYEQIDIDDIANALSKICRFGGQISHYYSVAQHSVLVSTFIEHQVESGGWTLIDGLDPKLIYLQGLFHDASEAYLGDLLAPCKGYFLTNVNTVEDPHIQSYRATEKHLQQMIYTKLRLPSTQHELVHAADMALLQLEGRTLQPKTPAKAWELGYPETGFALHPVGPDAAKVMFEERLKELTN